MTPAHRRLLDRRNLLLATQRSRRLSQRAMVEKIARTPARSDEERQAKAEAMRLMERARPD